MYDGRMIYFYKNVIFFVRADEDWAYLFDNGNAYIGMAENNFDEVQRLADRYLELKNST